MMTGDEMATFIEREARLFVAGEYPDKGVTIDEETLDKWVENAKEPIPLNVGHLDERDNPLFGALGWVKDLVRRGKELFGKVVMPKWLYETLEARGHKALSVGVEGDLSRVAEVSLVMVPRVKEARLFSGKKLLQFSVNFAEHLIGQKGNRSYLLKLPVDFDSDWEFTAEDGNALIEKGGMELFAKVHLGKIEGGDPGNKGTYKYPVAKLKGDEVTLFWRGLMAAKQRGAQQGEEKIVELADSIAEVVKGRKDFKRVWKIQSVLFDKEKFDEDKARKWLEDHDFIHSKVDVPEGGRYIRFRQFPPEECKGDPRTDELTDGIKAIVCPVDVKMSDDRNFWLPSGVYYSGGELISVRRFSGVDMAEEKDKKVKVDDQGKEPQAGEPGGGAGSAHKFADDVERLRSQVDVLNAELEKTRAELRRRDLRDRVVKFAERGLLSEKDVDRVVEFCLALGDDKVKFSDGEKPKVEAFFEVLEKIEPERAIIAGGGRVVKPASEVRSDEPLPPLVERGIKDAVQKKAERYRATFGKDPSGEEVEKWEKELRENRLKVLFGGDE
jgi:hypothetical protein